MKMKMKNILIAIAVISSVNGCTTNSAVQATGIENQLVVTSIHNHGPFSSLTAAKADTEKSANNYCSSIGKKYKKNYSIDHDMAIGQVVESTLYFECEVK